MKLTSVLGVCRFHSCVASWCATLTARAWRAKEAEPDWLKSRYGTLKEFTNQNELVNEELNPSTARALPEYLEPVPSVSEDTTRGFEPINSERK